MFHVFTEYLMSFTFLIFPGSLGLSGGAQRGAHTHSQWDFTPQASFSHQYRSLASSPEAWGRLRHSTDPGCTVAPWRQGVSQCLMVAG